MKLKVTLWKKNGKTTSKFIIAQSHTDALKAIGPGGPGDEFTVDGQGATIRYKIESNDDVQELSRYTY